MSALCQCDLSIIIPVYNLERFLAPMLKSLKEQESGYLIEHIFVLNNCTDNSEQVIRDSGLDCKILYEEKQGCGNARNKGFEEATGEYIWFMDGDDWLLSNTAVKDALDKANRENLSVLRIPYESKSFTRQYFSMVWQYLLKREFVEDFRFPSFQPCEDDVYMANVLTKAGYNVHTYMAMPCIDRPLYYYNYLREGSNMWRVVLKGEKI